MCGEMTFLHIESSQQETCPHLSTIQVWLCLLVMLYSFIPMGSAQFSIFMPRNLFFWGGGLN